MRAADHCFGQNPIFASTPFVAAAKFTENSAMTLRMNFSWKNFHAGNPRALYLLASNGLPLPVRWQSNTGIARSLRQRACFIISLSRWRFVASSLTPGPQISGSLCSCQSFQDCLLLARNPRVRERNSVPCILPLLVPLVAAGAQDYFAVPDFSTRDTRLIGILNHVTS